MFRLIAIVLMALAAAAHAEPKPAVIAPLAYNAPLIAAAPNAAIYSREYHGNFADPYLAAAAAAPYVASPYVAAAAPAPYVAAASPYVGSPYVAAAAPAPYVAAAPFAAAAYSAPILLKK